ncbi:cysteine desulfurase [archaeon]|jgi:cysteine desulfurase|nr:cysteine desulfurase [archaeon]MBT4648400.1 cysteine desulfurase [archaeon]
MKPIYLDYHATTPLDPRVFSEMKFFLLNKFGNAASIDHVYGNEASLAVKKARIQISKLIKSDSSEIIFNSGATESDNTAIFGIANYFKEKGNHIITTKIEHKAILDTCKQLEKQGFEVTYLNVDKFGSINLDQLSKSITKKTILISVMMANNEVGTIQPIKEIGKIAKNKGITFHSDVAQAFGHIPIDVRELNLDLMSISGHKIYAPKGIGVLYVNTKTKIHPLIYGGGHERGMRSGTLNVPSIVALGKAAEIAEIEMKDLSIKYRSMITKLYDELQKSINIELNGHPSNRLAHNLNIFIKGVDSKALINEVKNDIAISSGSACTTTEVKPSHVIMAMGYDAERAYSSIRIGIGRFTTNEDIKKTINVIKNAVIKLRNL